MKPLHLQQSVPDDGSVRPVIHEMRVSFPGDEELALVHHLFIEVESGRQARVDVSPQIAGNGSTIERGRVWWSEDSVTACP